MYLVSTKCRFLPDKPGDSVVLLGGWCLDDTQKRFYKHSGVSYSLLPCIWDDPGKRAEAVSFCERFYEAALVEAAECLNGIHGTSHDIKYWRILFGPWLFTYINVLRDRYMSLVAALKTLENPKIVALRDRPGETVKDWDDFVLKVIGDDCYNLQLYSQIAGLIDCEKVYVEYDIFQSNSATGKSRLLEKKRNKGLCRNVHGFVHRVLLNNFSLRKQYLISDLFVNKMNNYRLMLKSTFGVGILSRNFSELSERIVDYSDRMRNGFVNLKPAAFDGEFAEVFKKTVARHIPIAYVEEYAARRENVRRIGFKGRVLASSFGWKSDESFKFLAGEACLGGARFLAGQHGGNSGVVMDCPMERHIVSVVDTYYTYGTWSKENASFPNAVAGVGEELADIGKLSFPFKGDERLILLVGTSQQRYLIQLRHGPVSSQFRTYQEWQIRFIDRVSTELRSNLLLRLTDKVWESRKIIASRYPDVTFDDFSLKFNKQVGKSRLVVIDNFNTTFSQALLINRPTILFLNRNFYRFYDNAVPVLRELEKNKVLFFSPEDAADHVGKVFDYADDWWFSKDVQDARERYIEKFVGSGKGDLIGEWKKMIFQPQDSLCCKIK